MMTVKQVSQLTGVSVRTLQFYDRMAVLNRQQQLRPDTGYMRNPPWRNCSRFYFFKELDFTLRKSKRY